VSSGSPARTVLAVFLGYLTFLMLEIVLGFLAAAFLHSTNRASLVITAELLTFLSAAAGGAVAARMAPERPLAHAGALGLAVLTVTIAVSVLVPQRAQSPFPAWFPFASAVFGGAGAFLGGGLVTLSRTQRD